MTTPSRAARWAPVVAGALLALPVLLAPYPPMIDLPLHEATVSLLRHFGDPTWFPPGLYFRNLGHTNQLFHLAAWALSYVTSTALAARIVVTAAVLGLPLAAARLCDHLGASRWIAVVCAPVALGWLFIFGLIANLLGLAILVATLPSLDRFVARPTAAGAARCAGAVLLLYFAHEMVLFIYVGALGLFALFERPRPRETALRAIPMAFAVALVWWQQRLQAPLMPPSQKLVPTTFLPLGRKLEEIAQALYAPFAELESWVLLVIALAATATFASARWRGERGERATDDREAGFADRLRPHRYELLAAICFAGYLLAPHSIHAANLIHQRFLAPAFVIGAVAVAGDRRAVRPDPPRLGPLLAAIPPIGILLVTWPAFISSSRDHDDVVRLSRHIAPGSALATIEVSQERPDEVDLLKQPMALVAMSERGGRYLYSFTESPISPVMITPKYQWNEPVDRIVTRGQGWCPSYDFTRFRYVLLYSPNAALQLVASGAMAPEGRYVARAGFWVLYESTLPLAPLASPDGPGPADDCRGDTMTDRIHKVQAALLARVKAGDALPELPPE